MLSTRVCFHRCPAVPANRYPKSWRPWPSKPNGVDRRRQANHSLWTLKWYLLFAYYHVTYALCILFYGLSLVNCASWDIVALFSFLYYDKLMSRELSSGTRLNTLGFCPSGLKRLLFSRVVACVGRYHAPLPIPVTMDWGNRRSQGRSCVGSPWCTCIRVKKKFSST